jgi:hypothetical protein
MFLPPLALAMKRAWIHVWLFLAIFALSALADAAPDYVTAWPKQVALEKPDPVLGDKVFSEHWVYGEAFAKRFDGFPVENADPELKGKLKAMVLRIFMRNFWQEINPRYPEQYACEIDVYFDSTRSLPLSETKHPKKVFPAYPRGITASYRRLTPLLAEDKAAIGASKPVPFSLKEQPLIFAAPLDGRFSVFGVREYHPDLLPGLSVITLMSGFDCSVSAPRQKAGIHWISLLGERPWDQTVSVSPKAAHGVYNPRVIRPFDPGSDPESMGYFRVPEALNREALPKSTLIKVLNWCISQKWKPSDWRVNGRTIHMDELLERCDEVEQRGRVLPDTRYHPGKEGLQDQGF